MLPADSSSIQTERSVSGAVCSRARAPLTLQGEDK